VLSLLAYPIFPKEFKESLFGHFALFFDVELVEPDVVEQRVVFFQAHFVILISGNWCLVGSLLYSAYFDLRWQARP
jgi:hypothetical protein